MPRCYNPKVGFFDGALGMYPLEGLKVLDFSRVLAGPFASRMLTDLGADVVKVEPPEGDITRIWGAKIAGQSGFFTQQNIGKRCISIDLTTPGGQKLALALAKEADVVLENFRPGIMKRFKLDWPHLSAANPSLIMCSISGFGGQGPESERAAYAPIVHAETGIIDRQARISGHERVDLLPSMADTNAALHGLIGILSAVIMKRETGIGQHIDIAMIDTMTITDDQLHFSLDDAEEMRPMNSEVWDTGVGPILIAGDFRHIWRCLTTVMGVVDPTPPGAELDEKIRLRRKTAREYFAAFSDWEELVAALDKMRLAWGKVREQRDLVNQPTLRARGTITQVDDRQGGSRPVVRSPYRFSDAECGIRGLAPYRGEHNAEVLAEWLALDYEDTLKLEEKGILLFDAEHVSRRQDAPSLERGIGEDRENSGAPAVPESPERRKRSAEVEVEVNLRTKLD